MSHLTKDSATGHLLKTLDGHLAVGCYNAAYKLTPCIEYMSGDCYFCYPDGITPRFLTVTFADIEVDGCLDKPLVSTSRLPVGDPNQTFVLENQGIDPCVWWYVEESSPTWYVNRYGNTVCSGDPYTVADRFGVFVRKDTATRWLVGMCASLQNLTEEFCWFSDSTGIVGPPYDCATPFTRDNPTVAWSWQNVGKNGTATIIPGLAPGNPCPGGAPLYTDTDLSAYVGKVIHIEEDPDVCYQVAVNEDAEPPDTAVTVTKVCDDCADCCSEPEGESCEEV